MRHLLAGLTLTLAACNNAQSTSSESTSQYALKDTIQSIKSPSGREIEYRSLNPIDCDTCPFVFFSHGANAAYDRYDRLLIPLAERGFNIVVPNHTDSEEHKSREKYSINESLGYRLEDYELILDHYRPEQHISAGHSYGAMIAQITAGAKLSPPLDANMPTSKYNPEKVIAISPPGPIPNYMEEAGWKKVNAASFIVTGTNDIVPTLTENWKDHLVSFSVAPKGSVAVIYENMDHYMNGAYGRENQNVTPERTKAMEHLIDAIESFIEDANEVTESGVEFVEIRRR